MPSFITSHYQVTFNFSYDGIWFTCKWGNHEGIIDTKNKEDFIYFVTEFFYLTPKNYDGWDSLNLRIQNYVKYLETEFAKSMELVPF